MRKFSLFIILVCGIIATLFASVNTTSAQFRWSELNGDNTELSICEGKECSLKGGVNKTKELVKGQVVTEKSATQLLQDIITYALGFITLIAVIYILWSGFRIMTGNGDSGVMESSKKIIIYVIIGIVMMWLAYPIVAFIINGITKTSAYNFNLFPKTYAQQTFTESQMGTFYEYRSRLIAEIQRMEADFNIEKKVENSRITQVQNLLQEAYIRLPDQDPQVSEQNASNKRAADMYLEKARKEPDSSQAISNAIRSVSNFMNSAKIQTVQGSISATPNSGNSPLVVSFTANNVVDPSGATPPSSNYYWWIREGRGRKLLGQGAALQQTFTNEGSYTVFLDVISSSKNSRGYTDVLPLSTRVTINVAPKLGELVLLVNGVNVSNLDSLKISPVLGQQGIILDATASRAQNGQIIKTEWIFGNGNRREYNGRPVVEREVFATSGTFDVELKLTSNNGETFSKKLQLTVKDPIANIKVDKEVAYTKENISFSAENHFGDTRNTEYVWQIRDLNSNKKLPSSSGQTFSYAFEETGIYLVTLRTKSPNGATDDDSKIITIESRDPIASIDSPRAISPEQPNTFVFDGSKSFDPDTNSKNDLEYLWKINDQKILLQNTSNNGAKGTYTFDSTGEKEVSLTVSNKAGKVATVTQKFTVQSILAGNIKISPEVTQVGKEISFFASSEKAKFFEWNFGDGSPVKSGNAKNVTHTYARTGVYNMTLTLRGSDSSEQSTIIQRKIYVTDANNPFALINISNMSNSAIIEPNVCNGNSAYILKRAETSTLDGNKSINVDGSMSNLEYTWKYMGRISTLPMITETFKEL